MTRLLSNELTFYIVLIISSKRVHLSFLYQNMLLSAMDWKSLELSFVELPTLLT